MTDTNDWVAVRIKRGVLRRLTEAAKADGRSASNYLERLLEAHLAEVKA